MRKEQETTSKPLLLIFFIVGLLSWSADALANFWTKFFGFVDNFGIRW